VPEDNSDRVRVDFGIPSRRSASIPETQTFYIDRVAQLQQSLNPVLGGFPRIPGHASRLGTPP